MERPDDEKEKYLVVSQVEFGIGWANGFVPPPSAPRNSYEFVRQIDEHRVLVIDPRWRTANPGK